MPIPMERNDKIKANSDTFSLPHIPVLMNSYFVQYRFKNSLTVP